MNKRILYLLVIGLVTCFASQAFAQGANEKCDKRDTILAMLARKYNETIVSVALLDNGTVLERTESPDHYSFSLLISDPDGVLTCFLANGKGWNDIPLKKGPNL